MLRWIAVKPLQAAARFKLLNITGFRKNLKVAIDRSQADTRQPFTNHFINLICTWMGIHFTKFFQNNPALIDKNLLFQSGNRKILNCAM